MILLLLLAPFCKVDVPRPNLRLPALVLNELLLRFGFKHVPDVAKCAATNTTLGAARPFS